MLPRAAAAALAAAARSARASGAPGPGPLQRGIHFPGRPGSRPPAPTRPPGAPPPTPAAPSAPPAPYAWFRHHGRDRAQDAQAAYQKPSVQAHAPRPPAASSAPPPPRAAPPPPLPPPTHPPAHPPLPYTFSWARDIAIPLTFCAAAGTACLVAAGAVDAEDKARAARGGPVRRAVEAVRQGMAPPPPPTELPSWVAFLPPFFRDAASAAVGWWDHRSPYDRTFGGILAANLAVLAAWKLGGGTAAPGGWRAGLPGLWRSAMRRTFAQSLPPARPRLRSLFLSNWSHGSALHLAANMLALHALGEAVAGAQGDRQFAGVYAAAGLASAAASHAGRWLRRPPPGGLSLGASGAVYAILACAASLQPDRPMNLVLSPEGSNVTLRDVTAALLAFDALGALAGWRWLDHWGHLGGAAFGFAWSKFGPALWPRAQAAGAAARADYLEYRARQEEEDREAERQAKQAELKGRLPKFLGGGGGGGGQEKK